MSVAAPAATIAQSIIALVASGIGVAYDADSIAPATREFLTAAHHAGRAMS